MSEHTPGRDPMEGTCDHGRYEWEDCDDCHADTYWNRLLHFMCKEFQREKGYWPGYGSKEWRDFIDEKLGPGAIQP